MAATSLMVTFMVLVLSGVLCLPADLDVYIKLKEQREALQKLECEPKATWVYIESQLGPKDDLTDKIYYPHVVLVRRCLKECSFCGNVMMGEPDKTCKADFTGPRDVVVQLFNDVEHTRVITLMEHKSCKCV
ncbi:hypothetical protein GWK47_023776 [Chionoecetes opilio]|uniref:Platelet-derived growth factor (PDGF) family profile domain-containing protein n=1 Tax=Chionoecetes opilio TaxID=41210 RepID=A0A8J8WBK2_CHIOP|nr:hypothetical protein GWK47_027752 [Chionoecetes opilio]KAG0709954.1 hypothetical protein GWK47_023776 [Chionoecetes opilio]